MHVLQLTDTLPPRIGGIETALLTLFRQMPDVRFTVLTAQLDAHGAWGDHVRVRRLALRDAVLRMTRFLPPSLRRHSHLLAIPPHEWQRRMAASSLPADLVHIHSFAAFRYFAGIGDRHPTRLFALLVDWLRYFDAYQHPVLFTDHSLFGGPPEQFHAVRNDLLLERLRFVVCVERSGQANVQAFAAARGLPIRLWWIPNPIDTDAFRPGPLRPTNPLVLGYAGRYEKEGTKDVLRLAREAPAWVAFRLALAVSERDRAQAEQDVAEAGVEVLWNVPYTAMPDFYRRLHVFLDPYTFGAPRTALEALACGRVVIRLLGERGTPELPGDVSPALDARDSAHFFRDFARFRDPEILQRFGNRARALAEAVYAAPKVAASYRDVFRAVASAQVC